VSLFYSIAFWAFFALSSGALFVGALALWLVTLPFDRNGKLLHLYSCFWASLYFYVSPFWRLRVEGRRHLPWNSAAVLVANHQSLGDVLALFGLYSPFKWVSKESVFKAPFLGWNMSLNRYVKLKRGDKESIAKMMATCEHWLRRGVPVLLFPEGTRSPDGQVKEFKDGAFRLAVSVGCPVIPIVIDGTADTLPKHGLVMSTKSRSRVRVLEPIAPGDDVAALKSKTREIIVSELQRMRA
jgi:1-acyl-sn-glycerol-3-phosphate acyltransferase